MKTFMSKIQTIVGYVAVVGLLIMVQADKVQLLTIVVDVADREALVAAESLK